MDITAIFSLMSSLKTYAKAWMMVGDEVAYRAAWAMKPDMPYASVSIGLPRLHARRLRHGGALLSLDFAKL